MHIKDKFVVAQCDTNYNGEIFHVQNFTPDIHSEDRAERKRSIEEVLYSIFCKYFKK